MRLPLRFATTTFHIRPAHNQRNNFATGIMWRCRCVCSSEFSPLACAIFWPLHCFAVGVVVVNFLAECHIRSIENATKNPAHWIDVIYWWWLLHIRSENKMRTFHADRYIEIYWSVMAWHFKNYLNAFQKICLFNRWKKGKFDTQIKYDKIMITEIFGTAKDWCKRPSDFHHTKNLVLNL